MGREAEHAANKRAVTDRLRALMAVPIDSLDDATADAYSADASLHAFHPINELDGPAAIGAGLWRPLREAFPDLVRRDQIVAAGEYQGADYVCSMSYLEGTFENAWHDIPPNHEVSTLRCCSIDRVENRRIVESHTLVDTLDVMRQAGVWPVAPSLGAEAPWASPATGDGVDLETCDHDRGAQALRIVKAMHAGLGDFDGEDLHSMSHARYWAPGFMWYGPSGIGTSKGLAGFETHHQLPFLRAFPDRRVNKHIANVGEKVWPGQDAGFLGRRFDPWLLTCDPSNDCSTMTTMAISGSSAGA